MARCRAGSLQFLTGPSVADVDEQGNVGRSASARR